jgi:hypothetical protein
MSNPTLVTMFFDLTKLKDSNPSTRPIDFYLKNGKAILELDFPMYMFCDSTTRPLIQKLRDELVPNNKTIYIEKSISDYDHYKLNWDIIDGNRQNSIVYRHRKGDRVTASYFLMGMFKPLAIRIAFLNDVFNSSHYIWMDFGCAHVAPLDINNSVNRIMNNPRPKVCICYIHYRGHVELHNMTDFTDSGACGIATTVFSVENTYVNRLYSATMGIFYEKLAKGIGHTDETVFTYCYDRYPYLFSLYYGDYASTLTNYHHVRSQYASVKEYFIRNAISANRYDLAIEAAKNVYDALVHNNLVLPVGEVKLIKGLVEVEET